MRATRPPWASLAARCDRGCSPRMHERRCKDTGRRIAIFRRCATLRHETRWTGRSEEHTSELQSLMRISYAVICLKKNTINHYSLTNTDNESVLRRERNDT